MTVTYESLCLFIPIFCSVKQGSSKHEVGDIIAELTRAISVWSKSTPLKFTRLSGDQVDEADIRIVFST